MSGSSRIGSATHAHHGREALIDQLRRCRWTSTGVGAELDMAAASTSAPCGAAAVCGRRRSSEDLQRVEV